MNLLEALINAIRLPELRNKNLCTGGILIVFRLFANIAIPNAQQSALALPFNQQASLGLLDWFQRLQIILVLTAGTVVLMWFGELITEYGIGNGVSLIIFAGIIGRGPQGVSAVFNAHSAGGGLADYVPFIIFGLIALG